MFLILYSFIYTIVRIYIFAKVFYLMCMNYYFPESYPISLLTWWVYFMIFDIWIYTILSTKNLNTSENKDNETNT